MTRPPPKEICLNCGKRKPEPEMLYIVSEDGYVCNSECWDEYREKESK